MKEKRVALSLIAYLLQLFKGRDDVRKLARISVRLGKETGLDADVLCREFVRLSDSTICAGAEFVVSAAAGKGIRLDTVEIVDRPGMKSQSYPSAMEMFAEGPADQMVPVLATAELSSVPVEDSSAADAAGGVRDYSSDDGAARGTGSEIDAGASERLMTEIFAQQVAAPAERVGVYICECGTPGNDVVRVDELRQYVVNVPGVVNVQTLAMLCSETGAEFLRRDVRERKLTRMVIGVFLPRRHEADVRLLARETGIAIQMVNLNGLRQDNSWTLRDYTKYTARAGECLRTAAQNGAAVEALPSRSDENVLVIGAGVAGISAALALQERGRSVFLVERQPVIGGTVGRLNVVDASGQRAAELLRPTLARVLRHERIEVLTNSEVVSVSGRQGNFMVKVKVRARFVDPKACIGCGICSGVCPVSVRNEGNEQLDNRRAIYIPSAGAPQTAVIDRETCRRFNGKECVACRENCAYDAIDYAQQDEIRELRVGAIVIATGLGTFDFWRAAQFGFGRVKQVYSGMQFARLLDREGPTAGMLTLANGQPPAHVVMVHCAGSRSERFNNYCSGVCCTYMLQFTKVLKQKFPDAAVTHLVYDFCVPGRDAQALFSEISQCGGVDIRRMRDADSVQIEEHAGGVKVTYRGTLGGTQALNADIAVLAPALEGAPGAESLAQLCGLTVDKYGFTATVHSALAPVMTPVAGIYAAGCCRGPVDIATAVSQGQAAAGLIASSAGKNREAVFAGESSPLAVETMCC
ncbi:MAG: FAD-dependent oxidoreductase [Candidatus Omnitrophica bacterium]|nr:FAD-dependent oxidoreductase [Candidatus Omnitrophota bacterium]